MKILVTGYRGQLGSALCKYLEEQGHEYVLGIDKAELDITHLHDVVSFIMFIKPDVVIHCAAFTNVDESEEDHVRCEYINVTGTNNLVFACRMINCKLVFISTDYVFDGTKVGEYVETDVKNPLSIYGKSKSEGEEQVITLDKYFVLRISWLIGTGGNNFVDTMLRLGKERKELNVVDDQVGSPTFTFDLVKAIEQVIDSDKYGIYHITNTGFTSWANLARTIFSKAGYDTKVNNVTTAQYGAKAPRPLNSRLSKKKWIDAGFAPLPSWEDALDRCLEMKGIIKK